MERVRRLALISCLALMVALLLWAFLERPTTIGAGSALQTDEGTPTRRAPEVRNTAASGGASLRVCVRSPDGPIPEAAVRVVADDSSKAAFPSLALATGKDGCVSSPVPVGALVVVGDEGGESVQERLQVRAGESRTITLAFSRPCRLAIGLRGPEGEQVHGLVDALFDGPPAWNMMLSTWSRGDPVPERVPCGSVSLKADSARGFHGPASDVVELVAGETVTRIIELGPPCASRLQAVDEDGQVLLDAHASHHPLATNQQFADPSGVIEVAICPAHMARVAVQAPGFVTRIVSPPDPDLGQDILVVQLLRAEPVYGTVTPAKGESVLRVGIWGPGGERPCEPHDDGWVCWSGDEWPTVVKAACSGGEAPAGSVDVEAPGERFEIRCGEQLGYQDRSSDDEPERGTARLEVRLTEVDGTPAAGAEVYLLGDESYQSLGDATRTTDGGGIARFTGLGAGPYTVAGYLARREARMLEVQLQVGEHRRVATTLDPEPACFQVFFQESARGIVLPAVSEGPAWGAGIRPWDEVLAIEGLELATAGEMWIRKALNPTGEDLARITLRRANGEEYVAEYGCR